MTEEPDGGVGSVAGSGTGSGQGDGLGDLAETDVAAAVRASARAYADALAARDAKAAATWVVPETFVFYDDLRLAALHSTRTQLENWPLLTLVMILELRARIGAEELGALDGRALFERTITEGLEGAEGVDMQEVAIDDDGLHARILLEGQPLLLLRRDEAAAGARWLVDLPALIELMAPGFEVLARERVSADGKVATALIFVEMRMGSAVDSAIADTPPIP